MFSKKSFSRLVLISALSTLALTGCDSISNFAKEDKKFIAKNDPADKLYNQGLVQLQKRNFNEAITQFKELDRQHPYSEWGRKALVMSAFAAYESGQYDDSMTYAKRFLQLHPADKDAAYAHYLMAMSAYNQIPDVTRDQERTEKALQMMREMVERYPTSEYAPDVKEKILVARDQLSAKEMDIGRFYLQQRNYVGAVNRFREVISKYQDTRHIEEALHRLTECYLAMGVTSEAQTSAAILGHNFPQSQWYKDSYALLKGASGLEPVEDKGSWISRAFRKII